LVDLNTHSFGRYRVRRSVVDGREVIVEREVVVGRELVDGREVICGYLVWFSLGARRRK
jgi:hypothetical protein